MPRTRTLHTFGPNHHCTRLLTSIMSSKPFSWRVVGITKEALKTLHELNYRYKSREGLLCVSAPVQGAL